MGKYLINGSKYEIDESIQGEELDKTLRELAGPNPAPNSRNAKIDAYLAETDKIVGLAPGTSARQIEQESRWNPQAVSPVGARGLAQVMPATLKSLSERFGRKLDPHNEQDALEMHRELMRENMKKWGNQDDALRAYNGGWDPKKWDNKETRGYVEIISGKKAAAPSAAPKAAAPAPAPYVPYAKVRDKVDPATLSADKDWLMASRQLHSLRERKAFEGSDEQLAEYGKNLMGNFNSNMVDMTRYAADLGRNGSDEDKRAFLFLMDTYDNTEWSWEGAGRAAKGILTDPTNLVGVASLGIGTAGRVMASAAAKQGLKKLLMTGLGRTGVIAGADAAILGAAESGIRQGVEVTAGRRDEVSLPRVAGQAALSGVAGMVLGTAGDAAISAISGVVRRQVGKKASPGPVVPPAAVPAPTAPGQPTGAPVAPAPKFVAAVLGDSQARPAPGFVYEYINNAGGKGVLELVDTGDNLKVNWVDNGIYGGEPPPGRGATVKAYEAAIEFASSQNRGFISDDSVTLDAVRVYEALERRGYEVTKNLTAKLVEPPEVPTARWMTRDDSPVFTVRRKANTVGTPSGTPKGLIEPYLLPETVLTEGEIAKATARAQEGRLWVDDLPPVEAANPEAVSKIEMPDANTGLRSTPRSMEELTADGMKIADQLRALDDKTMHGVLESFRTGALPLEDSRIIARGVQLHADELRIEQANAIKKLGLSTNAQESVTLAARLTELENRLVPLSLADDAFGSMAGSMLRQRQEGLPGLQGVTVESLMAEKGLTKEAAEAVYVQLIEGSKQTVKVQDIGRTYDARITAALQSGDMMEAAMLTTMKQRELAAVVEQDLPGGASFGAKALELVISNVFTPTTVAINLVPAAVKTLVLPLAKALVNDPLQRATRVELAASYSAMGSTIGAAFRAARASYRYEQSLVTRGTGRILEGEMALTGRSAGYIRFFPRVLNATDEFLGQINYASFVSGHAAGEAALDGAAKGLTGAALTAHIKDATKSAMDAAYTQPSGEALIQPLVNKGVNLGLTGEELLQYVEREALRDPDALRPGSDEVALDLVRDVLYKRKFSGEGTASGLAQGYESMMNKTPSLKLVLGQLFFRTPIRVFEEGIRLTPGLQFIAPSFLTDLAGRNGELRQVRAQAEAMTSLALTGAVLSLYASGSITGDGAYSNWKAQRTAGDGPGPAPYTIRMSDGSTWSYRNFDPVATPFKIIVNGLERMDKLAIREAQGEFINKNQWDQALAYITTGTMSIAAALRDANLVAGVDQMIKFGENLADPEGKDDAWVKMFGEKLALLVPNTLHKIAKQNDPTMKDPASFWQVVETRLAGIHVDRAEIKTAYSYDMLGNVRQIADTGTLWNIFSVSTEAERAKGHSAEAQAVMLELDRLQKETGAVFSPPLKHKLTGDFDLRTTLTADGTETLYDRWQKNYRALQPELILAEVVAAPMPDGTFKHKAMKVETINKVMSELRDAAFTQMLGEEQAVIDKLMALELGKAKAQAGMLDFSNRSK